MRCHLIKKNSHIFNESRISFLLLIGFCTNAAPQSLKCRWVFHFLFCVFASPWTLSYRGFLFSFLLSVLLPLSLFDNSTSYSAASPFLLSVFTDLSPAFKLLIKPSFPLAYLVFVNFFRTPATAFAVQDPYGERIGSCWLRSLRCCWSSNQYSLARISLRHRIRMTHTNQLAILASLKGIVQPRYGGARNTLCCTARPHPFATLDRRLEFKISFYFYGWVIRYFFWR